MTAKPGSKVIDLKRQGAGVRILGFAVSKGEGRMRLGLDKKAWGGLSRALEMAHQAPDPAKAALDTMVGWLEAMAPALEDVDAKDVLWKVRERAARYGFRESPIYAADVERKLHGAVQRWENARRKARRG